MTTSTYTPRTDSLASHCIGFFTNNPDEHLTLEDITDKFEATRGNIHTLLGPAVEAGLLERGRDDGGDYLYKAGPAIAKTPSLKSLPAQQASMPLKHMGPVKRKSRTPVSLDIDALKVESGIPCVKPGEKGKWTPLFDKLKSVGDSIQIPISAKAAVSAAALAQNRGTPGKYVVHTTGPDTARIWRNK